MAWKRDHSVSIGTNTGRDLPCDAAYTNGEGARAQLECSLEAAQLLPEQCEYLPCGPGIRVSGNVWPV